MNKIKIQTLIDSLEIELPPEEKFLELSRICPINPLVDSNPNFERGLLLYALITKYKPKNILEIGTAEGFSTLCMAWAMTDCELNGRIFTIDPKPFDTPSERILFWNSNQEKKSVMLSTKDLWKKYAKQEWLEKIEVLTGFSGEILQKNSTRLPKMDMGFIDGHHVYDAILHDFHAFLKISSENFQILFDDYFRNGDVAKVVDTIISPNFDLTLIETDATMQKSENDPIEKHHMCWIDSSSLVKPLNEIFPKSESDKITNNYVKWEKRWKLRKSINKKLPFLSKIRFSH